MQRTEVAQLWTDFNYYWLRTTNIQKVVQSGRPIRTRKLTLERYELFCALYDWCVQKDVDPRLWVFALFRARRWMYAPQLERGHLMSERFLDSGKYQRVVHRGTLDGYRLYKKGPVKGLDPNRDLIPGAEQKKRVWQQNGQSDVCMLMTLSDSYGYHPESRWCRQCSLQAECQQRLTTSVNFDILALRRGEMTVEQARAQAHA